MISYEELEIFSYAVPLVTTCISYRIAQYNGRVVFGRIFLNILFSIDCNSAFQSKPSQALTV